MELKINIDETMFKDVIEKELKAFSREELHEIIREFIIEALKTDSVLKRLFVEEKRNSYGSFSHNEPSSVVIEAAKNIDLSPAYKEVQEMMINELKTNYQTILQNIMLKTIINGLCSDGNFRNNVESAVYDILYQHEMANQNNNY